MKRIFSVTISVLALSISLIPHAIAADMTPPQLVDFSMQNSTVNISKTDVSVVARFILSDDSAIETPNLLLKSLTTTQLTPFATVKELSRSGKFVSYEATAIIKVGQSPRIWEWVLYPLRDALGNASVAFGPGGAWVSQINVLDATYTGDVVSCERNIYFWNRTIQLLEDTERKFPDVQELAIFRFKLELSKKLDGSSCPNIKYPDPNYTVDIYSNLVEIIDNLTAAAVEKAQAEANAVSKAAADKAAAELKAAAEKAAADLKAAADKAAAEKVLADAKASAAKILAAAKAKAAAAKKKTTITCVKGKLTKKVTAVKPVCPKGYTKKK